MGNKKTNDFIPFAAGTYIMLFKQLGFSIENVVRVKTPNFSMNLKDHAAKLSPYTVNELTTCEVLISVCKPIQEFSFKGDL